MRSPTNHPYLALAWVILLCALLALPRTAGAQVAAPDTAQPPSPPAGSAQVGTSGQTSAPAPSKGAPTKVIGLANEKGTKQTDLLAPDDHLALGMGNKLVVKLDGTERLEPATKWVLYLDGQAMPDLSETALTTEAPRGVMYKLQRTDKNKTAWAGILGSPTWTCQLEVSVAQKDGPRLVGTDRTAVFELSILWTPWLFFAFVISAAVLFLLGWAAVRTPLLRDKLLPQIPETQRQYSLGYCQMAFWFALVIVSFLFLWALLWDYNTVSTAALTLMGIAAATGLGAVAANTVNNDAVTNADKTLREAGFYSPKDIQDLNRELDAKAAKLAKLDQKKKELEGKKAQAETLQSPGPLGEEIKKLEVDIKQLEQLQTRKAVYDKETRDYVSATWDARTEKNNYATNIFTDLITDKDGAALHRVQVVGWTIVLGLVFLVGVYRDLSMPEFSATLLTLMAISGGSYVGFKFPEKT